MTCTRAKMRLYLVNPGNPLSGMVKVKESRWNRYTLWKPLGLLILARLTPPEWDITLIDEHVGVPDYASMPRPDLVGITAFTSQSPRAYQVAAEFRSRGVPVVMGGIHATMCLAEALERVDAVVTGEGESTWEQVLEDARQGSLKRVYTGTRLEMDRIPPARHDLLPEDLFFKGLVDPLHETLVNQGKPGAELACDHLEISFRRMMVTVL